jgi:hypothetical protein
LGLNTGQEDTGISTVLAMKRAKGKEEVIRSLESSNPIDAIACVYRLPVIPYMQF